MKSASTLSGTAIWAAVLASGSAPAMLNAQQRTLAPLPEAIASFGAAVDANWLYVLGGHTGEEHAHSRENLSSRFMRLNLLDGISWEALPGGVGLQSVSLVASGGKLYRVGGMKALNAPGEPDDLHSVAEAAVFDPAEQAWSDLPPLPEARSSHDAVAYKGKLYVVGGWTLNGASAQARWIDAAYELDLAADTPEWNPLPPVPFHRRAIAVAAGRGKLFVLGGLGEDRQPSSRVDVFDLETREWSNGPELPDNGSRLAGFGISAIGTGEQVYASGFNGKLLRLNDDGTGWERITTLQFPRFFHRLVPGGDGLIAVGGAAAGGHIRAIETLPLAGDSSTPRVVAHVLPYPGHGKNRQGIFFHAGTLQLFGGNNSLGQHDFEPENFIDESFSISPGGLSIDKLPPFPVKRQSMVTAILSGVRDQGYVIGGFGHDGEVARSFADAYRYDFKDDTWTPLGQKLPAPRTQFGLVSRGSEMWIFGGLDYDPRREKEDQFRHLTDILHWDTLDENKGFEPTGQELRRPRRAAGCVRIDNLVYLIGGMRENFKLVDTCDVFDLDARTWSSMPSPSRVRLSPEVAVLDGRIYVAGGSSPDDAGDILPNATIECYDPATRSWSTVLSELPIPAKHMRMFATDSDLLLLSTHDQTERSVRFALVRPAKTAGGRGITAKTP